MFWYITACALAVIIVLLIVNLIVTLQVGRSEASSMHSSLKTFSGIMAHQQQQQSDAQNEKLAEMQQQLARMREEMYSSMGEMKVLAGGVGDLKKVLSNVKTRGILGEVQLGAILSEILAPDQYDENVATVHGSSERVEFALRLPGDGMGDVVYLPIDAKFPADTYSKLLDAYDTADREAVKAAEKQLIARIKQEAKDISTKYIYPPDTTDFAVMFLPVEGLYAEVIRLGMVELLQREYKVVIAGPTTMAALLNSLQTGFRTLAVQRHSSEVWELLGEVKTEFDRFAESLDAAQKRINQAGEELSKLVGPRTKAIRRSLSNVQSMPQDSAFSVFDHAGQDISEDR